MNILQRQSYNTYLNAIGNLAVTDGNFIVGNGTTWVAESGNTARTSLGLGTGDSPTFTGLTINGASGNTLVVDTNTLVVDATNGRVGIGTASPTYPLHINASVTDIGVFLYQASTGETLRVQGVQTTKPVLGIYTNALHAGTAVLTTAVAQVSSDNASSTGDVLGIRHDGSGTGLYIDANGTGYGLIVDGNNALVGINKSTSIGAQLHVVAGAASTVGLIVDTAASPAAHPLQVKINGSVRWYCNQDDANGQEFRLSGYDNGSGVGRRILCSRNTNASTPAAGHLTLVDKGGIWYYIWPDDTGVLRIGTSSPTNANDLSGTVVGDQTSLLAAKDLLDNSLTPSDSLQYLLEAKNALRLFVYKADEQGNRKYGGQEFFGIVTDFAPRYGKDNGKSLNEITLFGDIVNAISEIVNRIERLESAIA